MEAHMKRSLDLTNLDDGATEADIRALCDHAAKHSQHVAGVCSWPKFAPHIRYRLEAHGMRKRIKTVSVINFPHGDNFLVNVIAQAQRAVDYGAQELDLVINWQEYKVRHLGIYSLVEAVRKIPRDFTLKVILETGHIGLGAVYPASLEAIAAGADYLKTSTGKMPNGADLNATAKMCRAVKRNFLDNSKRVGIKYSGGIKTDLDALKFIWQINQHDLGSWLRTNRIRFGVGTSSKVLDHWLAYEGPFESPTIKEAATIELMASKLNPGSRVARSKR